MGKPLPNPAVPPAHGWDIAFTRISKEVLRRVEACVQELARRFQAVGLGCDVQVRQTPRGLSTFIAVVGRRGLLFIVDATLIDGMAVAAHPGAALDIRLLDACGDIVGHRPLASAPGAPAFHGSPDEVIAAAGMARFVTAIYLMAMGHFDLELNAAPAP